MRLGVLGPLLVVDDEGRQVPVPAPRMRVLLAALLLHANAPVPAEALAELVWDGAPPDGASITLRTYVHRLRTGLGPAWAERIVTRPPGYLCRADEHEVDALEFEALCRQADTAVRERQWAQASQAAERAVSLWRGAPLLDIASQALRDEFVPRLDQLCAQVLEDQAEAELQRGRHERLVQPLRELVAQHPLRERFHAQLMTALARCGRRAEALEVYRDARKVLIAQLGIEPGPEVRRLHERILAGHAGPDARPSGGGPSRAVADRGPVLVPRQLPPAIAHFTGRAEVLGALTALATPGADGSTGATAVISALGGTAGIGKTALAVYWGYQVAALFPDGQLYVNLHGFDPSDRPVEPAEAVRGFLDALGVASDQVPAGLQAQVGLYRSVLAGRRVLVVLDNARDAGQVRPLLPGAPGCLALVTSRDQLADLIALDGAIPLTLDLLSRDEARELMIRRLGVERTDREPDALAQLTDLCARLPLALNLAAARAALRTASPLAALVDELRDAGRRFDALAVGSGGADVRAVFSWSYRTLTPAAARMFRLVSLHPGADATPAVAASLAGIGRDRVDGLLRELARAHLLTEHAPGRYAFHDLLRAYAADLSRAHDPEADRRQALTRLFDHYLHTCHAAALLLNPGWLPLELADPAPDTAPEQLAGPEHAASWYRAELATLVAVIAHAAENRFHTHAWQTCWGLAGYLEAQGRRRDLLAVCTTALSAAEHGGDLAGQAFAHRRLGLIQQADDACADADVHFRYALELYDRLGDRLRKGNTHISVAKMHEGQHRFPDALAHVRQAIECFRASGYIGGQAQALNSAGWYAAELGMHDQALRDCGQALELVRTAGNRKGEAHVLDSLGHIHRKSGDYPTALDYYCQALEIHRKLGNRYFCAQVLSRIGDTHHCSDTPQASHDAWRQALAILDELEHPDARALRTKLTYAETDST